MDNLQKDTSSMNDQTICSNTNNANLNDEERALKDEEDFASPKYTSMRNTLTEAYKLLYALEKELHALKIEEARLDATHKTGLDVLAKAKYRLAMFKAKCEERANHLEMMTTLVKAGQDKVTSLRNNVVEIQGQIAKEKELQVVHLCMFEDEVKEILMKFVSAPELHSDKYVLGQISETKAKISKSEQMVAVYNRELATTRSQFSALVKEPDELKSGLTCLFNHLNGQLSEANKEMDCLKDQKKELTNSLHILTMQVEELQSQNPHF